MSIDTGLIAQALRDTRPYDKGGEFAKRINDMMSLATSDEKPDPASLSLVITGDPAVCAVMADAYAKALLGHGLIQDSGGEPKVETVNWPHGFEDSGVSRSMQEHGWAYNHLKASCQSAAHGILLIPGIYNKPYENWVDEAESSPAAENGALSAITSFMTAADKKEKSPVVILTGETAPMEAFIARRADLQPLFNGKSFSVCTEAPDYSTELQKPVKIGGALKLKMR
jgi:hypothetical protein